MYNRRLYSQILPMRQNHLTSAYARKDNKKIVILSASRIPNTEG